MILRTLIGAFAAILVSGNAWALPLQVTVSNQQKPGGFYFTPTWVGFHDGGFDYFDSGMSASAELEALAEGGDVSPLRSTLGTNGDGTARVDYVLTAPNGFPGAPIFDPGDSATQMVDVANPASNRFLSFGAMVIPSNDAFFGNDNPMAYEVFDSSGMFTGPITIGIYGDAIYDSGTEMNNGKGAAFSALAGMDTPEMGVVGPSDGLGVFAGTETAAGTTINYGIGSGDLLATVTVTDPSAVPEPSTLAIWGMLGLIGVVIHRKRQLN